MTMQKVVKLSTSLDVQVDVLKRNNSEGCDGYLVDDISDSELEISEDEEFLRINFQCVSAHNHVRNIKGKLEINLSDLEEAIKYLSNKN